MSEGTTLGTIDTVRVAVLGAGKMGGILLDAFRANQLLRDDQILTTVRHAERARALGGRWGVTVGTDNRSAAAAADVLILGVKPTQVAEVLAEIKSALHPGKIVISLAASVRTKTIEEAAGCDLAVVRAMPNTPAMVREGMTALCGGRFCDQAVLELAMQMFRAVGQTVVVDEKHMDAVTGLSGSGPAFLYIVIEALAEAGVNVGLPRDVATLLAAQTTLGSAKMVLETGSHPALLKDAVTTPAGCTVDGILEWEEGGLRVTLIKAVKRATQRAKELADS